MVLITIFSLELKIKLYVVDKKKEKKKIPKIKLHQEAKIKEYKKIFQVNANNNNNNKTGKAILISDKT